MEKRSISECRLYGFIDAAYLGKRNPANVTHELIDGGVDVIQVRGKKLSRSRLIELAEKVVAAAQKTPVPIIVNDNLRAATESGADGVHLGQDDWSAIDPAERLPSLQGMEILGLSTHSLDQALTAVAEGTNYIGVGPVYATDTKPGRQPVGTKLIEQVRARVTTPFFAIGGINLDNLDEVLAAGATRIAVVSAILCADNVSQAAAAFKKRLP